MFPTPKISSKNSLPHLELYLTSSNIHLHFEDSKITGYPSYYHYYFYYCYFDVYFEGLKQFFMWQLNFSTSFKSWKQFYQIKSSAYWGKVVLMTWKNVLVHSVGCNWCVLSNALTQHDSILQNSSLLSGESIWSDIWPGLKQVYKLKVVVKEHCQTFCGERLKHI